MKNKNKGVRTVNIALGLIVLVAVLLCSPLFGYARGIAPKDQREPAPASADAMRTSPAWSAPAEATPRPTPPPTPTPVVLPTAPPTPVPTPVSQRTPQPVVQQPVVQQPVYNNWQEEQYQPEPDYEPEPEDWQPEEPAAEEQQQSDTGGQIIDTGSGGVIQDADADLVINLPVSGSDQSTAITVVTPVVDNTGVVGDTDTGGMEGGGGEVNWQPSQDGNEAEPLLWS